jgi:peptide/nickel transport system substrate-binding protein
MRFVSAVTRRGVAVLTTCMFLLGTLAGVREARGQAGGTLVVALDQEPPTLDPHASPSAVTYQIIASVTENLLYRGPDGKLVPWLAE